MRTRFEGGKGVFSTRGGCTWLSGIRQVGTYPISNSLGLFVSDTLWNCLSSDVHVPQLRPHRRCTSHLVFPYFWRWQTPCTDVLKRACAAIQIQQHFQQRAALKHFLCDQRPQRPLWTQTPSHTKLLTEYVIDKVSLALIDRRNPVKATKNT